VDHGRVTGRAPGAAPTLPALAEVEVVPVSPVRVPHRGTDGTTRGTDDGVVRLVHLGPDRPAILEVRALGGGRLLLRASGRTPRDAEEGLERARFWSWVDDDLSPFLERFAEDELIGASVREAPWLRPFRRPLPFEVLMGAVCEQLITDERAQEIKRRIAVTHGRRREGLLDTPGPDLVAALAPAALAACGLAPKRAITLRAVAREVAAGRVDLVDPERHEEGWRRLRTLPGVGPWTLSVLALHGQGHLDALPAGDHAYRVLVARHRGLPPGTKAEPAEVVDFFRPYAGWRGVAGWHLLRAARRAAGTSPRSRG
jgi:3-methyladenine DNA glycosylase/8-oxoguanine DNA glycosylase